jgi:hypothetical protein
MIKKQIFLIFFILKMFSINFINTEINLINWTKSQIDIYPTAQAIKNALPKQIESEKTTTLDIPKAEGYFLIKLANELFFQFFYADFEDEKTFMICFGLNDTYKYSCTLINDKKQQDGLLLTNLSVEQANINLSKYKKAPIKEYITSKKTNSAYPNEINF